MIESNSEFGTFEMYCDFCDEYECFDTRGNFQEFIREAKSLGWKIIKKQDIWVHKCPACAQEIG
jgi:hypothetical protein